MCFVENFIFFYFLLFLVPPTTSSSQTCSCVAAAFVVAISKDKSPLTDADWEEDAEKQDNVTQEQLPITRDGILHQSRRNAMDFMTDAYEDVGSDHHIQYRVARDQHEDAVGIRGQPNVILGNE